MNDVIAPSAVSHRPRAEADTRATGRPETYFGQIGVLPWTVDRNWLTIFVVATFRFDPSASTSPIPLEPAPPRRLHAGPNEPGEPSTSWLSRWRRSISRTDRSMWC